MLTEIGSPQQTRAWRYRGCELRLRPRARPPQDSRPRAHLHQHRTPGDSYVEQTGE